jgi:hypothetical protein
MFNQLVSPEEVVRLLAISDPSEVEQAISQGELGPEVKSDQGHGFRLGDVVTFELSRVIRALGVDDKKSLRYAEAILASRLAEHDETVLDWIENESQELFCLIADKQLARIYLRDKESAKEVDVGAVRPVLFPITQCEINVFRVIRPVIYRAKDLLAKER